MIISYAFYQLEAVHSLNSLTPSIKREGCLLKVVFESGLVGYADCHAWPELGDLPCQEQLNFLARGILTPLTSCALAFASLDAKKRCERKNILESVITPQSHFLVTDIFELTSDNVEKIIEQGFTHVKLKMGRQVGREIECLRALFFNTSLKLRLDFNEKLNIASFYQFLSCIEDMRSCIDFIEDPFPFDCYEWTTIQNNGWILACDQQFQKGSNQPEAARVLIVKPALQSEKLWQHKFPQTLIVTSYLGHPLGQVAAAYIASIVDPSSHYVHGLLSHQVYQPTNFSKHLNSKGPSFINPPGIGFGFDHELEECDWVLLENK